MKIYDCTIFLDEKMMYDLRLNLLNEHVYKFVVVESLYTHAGNKKKALFNIDDYKKFKDKIIYILLDKEPEDIFEVNENDPNIMGVKRLNSLKRIKLQYDSLLEGIKNADQNDLIVVSDCDEIPKLNSINSEVKNKILIFKQYLYYFKLNLLYKNYDWYGSKACTKKNLRSFEWLKYVKNKKYNFWRIDTFFSNTKYTNIEIIEDGGWHFSKVKKPEDIYYTLSNYGEHNEFEKAGITTSNLKEYIDKGELYYNHFADKSNPDKFSKNIKLEKNNKQLPKFISENEDIYKEWLA